ncbi:unnamed protein product [marine sediment metagenome]|uniref:Photosynthesis system II assembly factor Ycf48/Hcf136-like domain-containing protein n=1 Tax=marine sediment metagenome TaxID=412755 RepID=X1G1U6_9ZZZZ
MHDQTDNSSEKMSVLREMIHTYERDVWNFAFSIIGRVFLNDKEGWDLNKDQVYRTTDRGQNWLPLKADNVLTDTLKNYPQLAQVQFISSKVGWLLLETTELKKSILLKTSDGGNTWTVL